MWVLVFLPMLADVFCPWYLGCKMLLPIDGSRHVDHSCWADCTADESGHGSIDKAAFRAALSNQNAGNTATSWSLATYDAIWSIAIGAAAAARFAPGADGPGAQVTGTDVMQLIQKGAFPEFEGAAGRRGFLPNGGTDLNHTFLEISNYGTLRGSESPRLAVVAKFDLQSRHVEMVPGQAVVWANGREYPYVSATIYLPTYLHECYYLSW